MEYAAVPGITEVFVPDLGSHGWDVTVTKGRADIDTFCWDDTGHGIMRVTVESEQNVSFGVTRID